MNDDEPIEGVCKHCGVRIMRLALVGQSVWTHVPDEGPMYLRIGCGLFAEPNGVPTRDEHGADPSRRERDRRHEVEAAILEVLVLLDTTQEREGRAQDEANRLEATGMLFEIFERLSSRAGGSDG